MLVKFSILSKNISSYVVENLCDISNHTENSYDWNMGKFITALLLQSQSPEHAYSQTPHDFQT